jgi:hypothetical protein
MLAAVISPDIEDDADKLECRWGVAVALEMLHEHVITVLDFFQLCEEAANATSSARHAHTLSPPPGH